MVEEKQFHMLFGKLIRYARKQKGWSQEDLAEEADLSLNYIGLIERGETKPSFYNVYKLSKALNMNLTLLTQQIEKESEM